LIYLICYAFVYTGLPTGVIISFVWVIFGLVIAWYAITFHQLLLQRKATDSIQQQLTSDTLKIDTSIGPSNLFTLIQKEKGALMEKRTVWERMFSFKAFHGTIMALSWSNIAGRIFVTPLNIEFTCHTYPVYKPTYEKVRDQGNLGVLVAVPTMDSSYAKMPWAYKEGSWAAITFFGPVAIALVIGFVYSYLSVRRASAMRVSAATGAGKA
jgi:hypothetical protein